MTRTFIVAFLAMLALRCNSILGIEEFHRRADGGAGSGQASGGAAGLAGAHGGAGGALAGSLGGVAGGGAGGSAGAGGSGGTLVPGAGGASGTGNRTGSGGTTGNGGAIGAGGATAMDAGVVNCAEVAFNYSQTIVGAKICGNGPICDKPRPSALCSDACTTFIANGALLDPIYSQWMAGNCAAKASPCIDARNTCATPPTSAYCHAAGFGNVGDCEDDPPQP
jgi:hypothetical protein